MKKCSVKYLAYFIILVLNDFVQVAADTTSPSWTGQQQQQQQVPVVEMVDSSTPGVMYSGCPVTHVTPVTPVPPSADCSVTRREDVKTSSTSVTPPRHTSAHMMPSSLGRSLMMKPPPYPTLPTYYKHLLPHRIDVDVTTAAVESRQMNDCCEPVNSNVDLQATRSELASSDDNNRTTTYWTRCKSLSLPTRK